MDGCTCSMTSLPCSLPCIRGYEEGRGLDGRMLAGRGGSGTPPATDRTPPLDQWSLDWISEATRQLHLNFRRVQGQRFAPVNCIGGCRWECGTVTRAARKVTTSPSLPPRSFSFSLPQMGYSGDGPDRPWFGFWFMFLWSSNQRFHLLLLYGSWDDEWCSLSVKPSLCVFAPHFNC